MTWFKYQENVSVYFLFYIKKTINNLKKKKKRLHKLFCRYHKRRFLYLETSLYYEKVFKKS